MQVAAVGFGAPVHTQPQFGAYGLGFASLRVCEIVSLKVSDIDSQRMTFPASAKNRKVLAGPMPAPLRQMPADKATMVQEFTAKG